jgi:hypothetical protein
VSAFVLDFFAAALRPLVEDRFVDDDRDEDVFALRDDTV